jgi:hypothetical protein
VAKRKSIGCDPLDWIGEAGAESRKDPAAGGGSVPPSASGADGSTVPDQGQPGGIPQTMLSLADPSPPLHLEQLQIERQLLLVEEAAACERPARPLLNQRLWTVLLLLISLGVATLLFQETRRQWSERIVILDRALERIEKEKQRNEQVLAQVISEKEGLIREKQGALTRAEALREEVLEELRYTRAEGRRLQLENQDLLERILREGDERRAATSPQKSATEENRHP